MDINEAHDRSTSRTVVRDELAQRSSILIDELLHGSIIALEDWDSLPPTIRNEIRDTSESATLLTLLVRHGLLTPYQADRVSSGTMFGLLVDHYRVLDRLGAGGMGVVFKAENLRMRRPVALKILTPSHERDPRLLQRFFSEIRSVAQLQHPNIVSALDAGETEETKQGGPKLHYLVMEYVPGHDLEQLIVENGPMSVVKAVDVIHQIASALVESAKRNLIHRDIKPSNIRVTPEGLAKLLDFGLSRSLFGDRLTQPGTIVGTLDFMPPEQMQDASKVDIRADIYSLGATLFWCLTGRPPMPRGTSNPQEWIQRLMQSPPSVRSMRADVPEELDAVVTKLLSPDPDDRYATPQLLMRALLPFLKAPTNEVGSHHGTHATEARSPDYAADLEKTRKHSILIVDDEPGIRTFCRFALQGADIQTSEAANGRLALDHLKDTPADLVLLDVDMPAMTGQETLQQLRENPPWPNLKIIMFSGRSPGDAMAQLMVAGADDYLTKPFSAVQLQARVRAALRLKSAQDNTARLNKRLLALNAELEKGLTSRDSDLVQARNALVLALAKLVEYRDTETGSHLTRIQRYCRCLCDEAARMPHFKDQIDSAFIDMLDCCAPLHDIGKVGLPDHILMKPGKLTMDERVLMQAHTVIGSDTLREVARQHGFAQAFLQMAIDITRHHHERVDGTGYPDRLAGNDIPLSARIVAIADVYDALRSRRVYKPALAHQAALQLMMYSSPGHFDPALIQALGKSGGSFESIFKELAD